MALRHVFFSFLSLAIGLTAHAVIECDNPNTKPITTAAEYKARMSELPQMLQTFPAFVETEGWPGVIQLRENPANGLLRFEEIHKTLFSYSGKPSDVLGICVEKVGIKVVLPAKPKNEVQYVEFKDDGLYFLNFKLKKSSQNKFDSMLNRLNQKSANQQSNSQQNDVGIK
jgi:hypothetical protein